MNTEHQAIQSDLSIGLGHFTFNIVTAHTSKGHFELPMLFPKQCIHSEEFLL